MGDESWDSTGPTRAEGQQHSPAARNIKRANITRKRRGEVAEAAFLAKAASLGFGVAKPWGDSERYDFILDSGHNFWDSGHNFWRVQVKSTRTRVRTRYVLTVVGRSRAPYSRVDVDFLAAYVVPKDLWYIIPIDAAGSRTSLYFCAGEGGESKFEKYRDAAAETGRSAISPTHDRSCYPSLWGAVFRPSRGMTHTGRSTSN